MSIWVGKDTRLLVQGLTGREGTFHALACREYGTQVVAGVTPGKGGTTHEGIPVFDTVADAVRETGANASMIFVPPPFAADAIVEAADAGVARDRVHHRGDPDQRHAAREGVPRPARRRRQGRAADRAQLSRASSRRASARSGSCPAASTGPAASA